MQAEETVRLHEQWDSSYSKLLGLVCGEGQMMGAMTGSAAGQGRVAGQAGRSCLHSKIFASCLSIHGEADINVIYYLSV